MPDEDSPTSPLGRVLRFWSLVLRGPGPGERAGLYRSLATLLDAGFGAREATDRVNSGGAVMTALRAAAAEGRRLADGLADSGDRVTPVEVALVAAGERGGQVVHELRRLADRMDVAVAARRRLYAALAYPVLVLHVALLLPTIPLVGMSQGMGAWLRTVVLGLLVIWGVPFLAVSFYAAFRDDPGWSRWFCRIPAAGRAIHTSAVARFAWTFASLHDAGILHDEAVAMSGRAAGLGWMRQELEQAPARLAAGEPMPAVLATVRSLPADVRDFISTGDATGTLTESMTRAGTLYDELAGRAATAAAVAGGAVTYILAVLAVVGMAFGVFAKVYGPVFEMLD